MLVTNDYFLQASLDSTRTVLLNPTSLNLRLYTNNYTPLPTSSTGAFTEATYTGYSAPNISGAWGAVGNVVAGQWRTSTGSYTFTCTGGSPQTIYGYFVNDGSGNVWFAELFAAPVTLSPGGPSLVLVLNFDRWSASNHP